MSRILEVCCFSVEDARVAQESGADRVELCAGRSEDGTTPSLGMLEQARVAITIPVFPMVRPRGGDFVYGPDEFAAMSRDVAMIVELGFPGVVLGSLNPDNSVDVVRTTELVEQAGSLDVTFNRAFDEVPDPIATATVLTQLGVRRILTSGQRHRAGAGGPLLRELIGREGVPIIMPGGGVRPDNAKLLLDLGATELHSTCTSEPGAPIDSRLVAALAALVHGIGR